MRDTVAPDDLYAELRLALAEQRAYALRASAAANAMARRSDPVAEALAKRVVALRLQLEGDVPSEPRQIEPVPIAKATRKYHGDDD